MKSTLKGRVCMKCGIKGRLTRHHILPRVHYGNLGQTEPLCQNCHRIVESIYLEAEKRGPQPKNRGRKKLSQIAYYKLWHEFIKSW